LIRQVIRDNITANTIETNKGNNTPTNKKKIQPIKPTSNYKDTQWIQRKHTREAYFPMWRCISL